MAIFVTAIKYIMPGFQTCEEEEETAKIKKKTQKK